MTPCIETASGIFFDFLDPKPETVDIFDIAHALSHICRFTGHSGQFYSVAQHSVYVSMYVTTGRAFEALMHDAPEAYIGDVSSPLKSLLPEYRTIERRVTEAVTGKFGLPIELSPEVKHADIVMLNTERLFLLHSHDAEPWSWLGATPTFHPADGFVPWSASFARIQFLRRFFELGGVA